MTYKYLILGLLTERPMSGYDIKKQVKTALNAITSASYGTLYPMLHQLLEDGCVEVEEVPQHGRPSKKVYSITESGRDDLIQWLKQPAVPDQIRREFLLKLYLGSNLSEQDLRSIVSKRRVETDRQLQVLRSDRQTVRSQEQGWVLDYALSMCEAESGWLERLEAGIGVAQTE